MNKKLLFVSLGLAILAIILSVLQPVDANSSGSPSAKTGGPGDGLCTDCHSGTALLDTSVLNLNTDIPTTGYVPGQTYNISVILTKVGCVKSGFQIGSFNTSGGTNSGTFVASTDAKILSSGKYATHKNTSNTGTDGRTWTLTWTAPPAGNGIITFYYTANASNNMNNDDGDIIYKDSHAFVEGSATGISSSTSKKEFSIFPNPLPLGDHLNIYSPTTGANEINIFDIKGSLMYHALLTLQAGNNILNVSNITKGLYVVKIKNTSESFEKTVFVY